MYIQNSCSLQLFVSLISLKKIEPFWQFSLQIFPIKFWSSSPVSLSRARPWTSLVWGLSSDMLGWQFSIFSQQNSKGIIPTYLKRFCLRKVCSVWSLAFKEYNLHLWQNTNKGDLKLYGTMACTNIESYWIFLIV